MNNEWLVSCPSSVLKGLPRSISDHCPLIMETKITDWGPIRFINDCSSHPDFKQLVANSWGNSRVTGWGRFVVKEKLKELKSSLKQWNHSTFGLIEKNI